MGAPAKAPVWCDTLVGLHSRIAFKDKVLGLHGL